MADLLVEKQGHTTIFTINRPERMNSLGGTVIEDLTEGVKEFQEDPNQYVAIVTGAGEKAFCAGADLKEMAAGISGGNRLPIGTQPIPDMAGLSGCDKVTIAAVNGLAIAGGIETAISCDIRLASENAWFGVFEIKRGILAGLAVSVLPRLMPLGAVMDIMLSGDRITAEDAYRLGLVSAVVSPDKLMETAIAKAEMIGSNSQAAVWGTKQVLRFWRNALIAEQQKYYEAVMHRVVLSGDLFEGPLAFSEKREPKFSQKWPSVFDKK